jgi:hypothetical protein
VFNLTNEQIEIVKEILKRFLEDQKVWVFGSRIKKICKPYADLDLVIVSELPTPTLTIALLREAFSESNLPFKVDILDWASLSENFRQVILAEYLAIN